MLYTHIYIRLLPVAYCHTWQHKKCLLGKWNICRQGYRVPSIIEYITSTVSAAITARRARTYVCTNKYIHIYIYMERERKRGGDAYVYLSLPVHFLYIYIYECIYIYIFIYIYMYICIKAPAATCSVVNSCWGYQSI